MVRAVSVVDLSLEVQPVEGIQLTTLATARLLASQGVGHT